MKLGIHGEFQRVLVENGILGFILYIYIWFKSISRSKKSLSELVKNKMLSKENSKFIFYSFFIPLGLFIGTEASSMRSFIILCIISLLPDLLISIKKNLK